MNRFLPPAVRRLVLGSAMLAATLVALLPDSPDVSAATALPILLAQDKSAADQAARDAARDAQNAAKDAARDAAREAQDVAREAADAARTAAREARDARRRAQDVDISIDLGDDEKSGRRKGARITVDGVDRNYDSFDQFLDRDPALASMVLGIVFIVFLTPILIIGLIIWYKMRKNRMQQEAMLKLAEKGIVPPAEAMAAIGAGRVDPVLGAAAATAPLAEQARALRKQAAWSDLRKGVLIGGVGFALTLYYLFEYGQATWLGLVLLFVGVGYVVLWFFEDRQAAERAANPVPSPGPGDTRN